MLRVVLLARSETPAEIEVALRRKIVLKVERLDRISGFDCDPFLVVLAKGVLVICKGRPRCMLAVSALARVRVVSIGKLLSGVQV